MPQPGGPYIRMPPPGLALNFANSAGCWNGRMIASSICCLIVVEPADVRERDRRGCTGWSSRSTSLVIGVVVRQHAQPRAAVVAVAVLGHRCRELDAEIAINVGFARTAAS